jgi:hypothetical protein
MILAALSPFTAIPSKVQHSPLIFRQRVMHNKAINKGLSFIASQQLQTGNFTSYSSESLFSFQKTKKYLTTYIPSLVLSVLNTMAMENELLTSIKQKTASYIMSQKSKNWTWNYWDRVSSESTTKPYPDDLDDTFVSLSALQHYDPSIISGESLAAIIQVLTAVETGEGGPYRTWLTNAPDWQDVDLAVNANIGYFLFLHDIELNNVTQLIENAIKNGVFQSKYYPTPYPLFYFIARWYRGKYTTTLIQHILDHYQHDKQKHPLFTALTLSSLLKLGYSSTKTLEELSDALLTSQAKNGSWPSAGMCCDPSIAHIPHYAGSPVVTTALALEALFLKTTVAKLLKKSFADQLNHTIWQRFEKEIDLLQPPLNELAHSYYKKLVKTDKHQHIALFPYYFAGSLETTIPPELLITLGTANAWGWLAYSTLDDVLDGDAQSSLLPLSLTALDTLNTMYANAFSDLPDLLELKTQLLHTMHAATARELLFARAPLTTNTLTVPTQLPDYSDLRVCAEKSIGHALGPLALLFSLGHERYSEPVQLWLDFMHHYLTSKQLHDDAHDWEDDLKRGHLTPVTTLILEEFSPQNNQLELHEEILNQLRSLFWHTVVDQVSAAIFDHLNQARQSLQSNHIITKPEMWFSLLDSIEKSTKSALSERDTALQFISSYHS